MTNPLIPTTIGQIIQDATTETALHFLGREGFEGIDDTDIEVLTTFCIEVTKRATEIIAEHKRTGRTVTPTFDLEGRGGDDPRDSVVPITGRELAKASKHPSVGVALQEVSHQRWRSASLPSTHVASVTPLRPRNEPAD